ncbi:MAG: hypothetical protein ACREBC_33530, partial [Pyrinomonadaceae bacterium]
MKPYLNSWSHSNANTGTAGVSPAMSAKGANSFCAALRISRPTKPGAGETPAIPVKSLKLNRVLAALLAFVAASSTVFAQQPAAPPPPTATPAQDLQVPSIAPDYKAAPKPWPELGRVGVELDRQRPLSLHEALGLALENNKDIEVARQNVKIAEFDLIGSRGAFDPRSSSASYFERIESPIFSFLSGGSNGSTTQNDFTHTTRLEGHTPKFGGNYRLDFS